MNIHSEFSLRNFDSHFKDFFAHNTFGFSISLHTENNIWPLERQSSKFMVILTTPTLLNFVAWFKLHLSAYSNNLLRNNLYEQNMRRVKPANEMMMSNCIKIVIISLCLADEFKSNVLGMYLNSEHSPQCPDCTFSQSIYFHRRATGRCAPRMNHWSPFFHFTFPSFQLYLGCELMRGWCTHIVCWSESET